MPISRILIIKLSSLGDVIHALPVAGALRRRFTSARIVWLAGPAAATMVRMCRHVDQVLTWNPGRRPRLEAVTQLRAIKPQVALDLQGLARTSVLAWLSGARWRVGFRSWQEGARCLCNLPVVAARDDLHAVDGYQAFAQRLGAEAAALDFGLEVPPAALEFGRAATRGLGEPLVALAPGTRWATKKWPARHFAALAARLGEAGMGCVVLGGAEDRDAGAAVAAAAPRTALDLTGRTSLAQTAGVLVNCTLAVCHDSGPMHLAAALGVPVVALFGPTDPGRTGPYGQGHAVVQAPVGCVGCRRRRCAFRCMDLISPQRVLAVVMSHVGGDGSAAPGGEGAPCLP